MVDGGLGVLPSPVSFLGSSTIASLSSASDPFEFLEAQDRPLQLQDRVHTWIELPGCLRCIIDSPLFQRLRKIQQLTPVERVYPCATHSRFEHSLGVGSLAYRVLRKLRSDFERITGQRLGVKDIVCVVTAALTHDVGHPMLSHVWENIVKSIVDSEEEELPEKERKYGHLKNWTHEVASKLLVKEIW